MMRPGLIIGPLVTMALLDGVLWGPGGQPLGGAANDTHAKDA